MLRSFRDGIFDIAKPTELSYQCPSSHYFFEVGVFESAGFMADEL